ncbi:MAG: DUF4339 domain-containing protein [Pseudobdellovibrionaceae bacterium]|nr:DUF4339 domain-containing protein [Bdellovibrionales bacterium]USN47432.1 MAG: DUF4339 domain-containing protein [Pseudobdellovibrionaceae bacterium]
MMIKWYACLNEEVSGPYTTDQVKQGLDTGEFSSEMMIWGRAMAEWLTAQQWRAQLDQLLNQPSQQNKRPQMWHYAYLGESFGPLPRTELLDALAKIDTKKEVLIWTKGMKSWADLFHFQDIIEDLGINRREFPRARVTGSVVIHSDERVVIGRLATIGAGGFGAVQLDDSITAGNLVTAELKTELLSESIKVRAIVQYVSQEGFVGFKFERISAEAQNEIIAYVNKTTAAKAA